MNVSIKPMQRIIQQKLEDAFSPENLEIINDSASHQGHSGDDGSGESHFIVKIKSQKLDAKSKIEKHRAIHEVLSEELKIIHALQIHV